MTDAEITAYLLGFTAMRHPALCRAVINCPYRWLADYVSADELAAYERLGGDMFRYWVRRGMDDAQASAGR